MNIRKALKKAKKTGQSISSQKAEMFSQTKKTLMFWLLKCKDSDVEHKVRCLRKILDADDWEIDFDE